MADFNNQWIEIFKPGDYGDKGTYGTSDLQAMVKNFEAGVWKPPAVLGHPRTDAPAMGWASALRVNSRGALEAQLEKVQPELLAHVESGRYPNRSIAIYRDPKGTGPAVRHIGFLGAMPPEVKGLEPIKFSDGDFVAIDFKEEEEMTTENPQLSKEQVGFLARFAETLKGLFGGEGGGNRATFTEEQVQQRIEAATKPLTTAVEALTKKFDEAQTNAQKLTTEGAIAAGKAKAASLVSKLKAAGQWIPAFTEMGMESTLENLAVSGSTIKFGEPGKEKEVSAFESMAQFLEAQSKIVPTGQLAGKVKGPKGKVVHFNEAKGLQVDPASVALSERADEIATTEKIPFGDALKKARREMESEAV
jgi:hypothetical protein